MTKSKLRRAIAAVLCLACVVLIVIGSINLPKKNNDAGQTVLNGLRTRTLLNITGDGVVESYVNIAKKQAQEKARDKAPQGAQNKARDKAPQGEREKT